MAEKKKTTTKKTSTAKKAVTKKVTPKKVTTKKKLVRKTPTTKTAPKTTPRVMDSVTASVLSFSEWKTIVGQTFTALKSVWWRVGVIGLLSLLSILVLFLLGSAGTIGIFGGIEALENEFSNLQTGTPNLGLLWGTGGIFILFMILVFVVSFITNIAGLLTVKKYLNKQDNNPLKSFFSDSWKFLGRYAWMSVRIFWFVMWPALLIATIAGLVTLAMMATDSVQEFSLWLMWGTVALASLVLIFWRSVRMTFGFVALIESDKTVNGTFDKADSLVKGDWWLTVWALFLFFVPIYLIQGFMGGDEEAIQNIFGVGMASAEMIFLGLTGISFFMGLFLFGPLSLTFIYLLMRHFSKRKKIKL